MFDIDPDELASRVAHETAFALAAGAPIAPFSDRLERFSVDLAFRAAAKLNLLRGGRPVGRKLGFTNRALWERYTIDAPIWGRMTDRSVRALGPGPVSLGGLLEPRIEPEIVLALSAEPRPEMDDAALADCVAWAAPAFELVHSVYPGWRFRTADAAAANALHGRLLLGRQRALSPVELAALPGLGVTLERDGAAVEAGVGAAVLGGPLTALRHLVVALAARPEEPPLAAGDLVSTGTLTDARAIAPGERWEARFTNAPFAPIAVAFAA